MVIILLPSCLFARLSVSVAAEVAGGLGSRSMKKNCSSIAFAKEQGSTTNYRGKDAAVAVKIYKYLQLQRTGNKGKGTTGPGEQEKD